MKKRILLFTAISGISALTLSSYEFGPAANGAGNLTGSPTSNGNSCAGPTCHGGNGSATTVNITLDSAGTSVTSYKPGMSYTVNITGTNSNSLPKFGFQFVSCKTTGTQAGSASSLPANVHSASFSGLSIIEHSAPLTGTSGAYSVSFTWTAPAAGTGAVTLFSTLNAVNGNSAADAQDVSANTHLALTEEVSHAAVSTIASDVSIIAYPNPATHSLNIKMSNANTGTYTMNVFDISGKRIMSGDMEVNASSFTKTINTTNWVAGYYSIELINNGAVRMIPVVKQ